MTSLVHKQCWKHTAFHVKWLQGFKASLLWQAFEMYSWLRVSVSVKQRVYTSRCRSGFRYLGCLGTIVTVLQIFVLLWHGGSVGSVTHLSGRANKRMKGRQNIYMNSWWRPHFQWHVLPNWSDGLMDFLFQNRMRFLWILSTNTPLRAHE